MSDKNNLKKKITTGIAIFILIVAGILTAYFIKEKWDHYQLQKKKEAWLESFENPKGEIHLK